MKQLFVIPAIALGALDLCLVWLLSKVIKLLPSSQPTNNDASVPRLEKISTVLVVAVGIAGLWFRLYGFTRSFWLDEFGTLWAIGGSFSQLLDRVQEFHGQSPFYYILAWIFIRIFGESEFVLRFLSLLLGVGTIYGAFILGKLLHGKTVGLISALFLWLSSPMVQSSVDARPYALALFMTVIMFYGFARAAQRCDILGRCLFIAGGAGLFSAHYSLIPVATGIALGYSLFSRLRVHYPARRFVFDIGMQLLISSWCIPQIVSIWSRRDSLSWLGSTDYLVFAEVIAPFAVLALAPYVCGKQLAASNFEKAMKWVFWLAIGAQIGSLYLLTYFGSNLLHVRYMITIVIPAALLASIGLVQLPLYLASVPLAYWLLFIGGSFIIDFNVNGSFSGVGIQDWRKAVTCLNTLVSSEPGTLVLYRSGFVEEDNLINGQLSTVTLAPLRSPGRQPVTWNLVELTYSWDKPRRDSYFAQVVEPAIHRTESFYYVTCTGCFNKTTGQYTDGVLSWVEERFPGRFQTESIPAGRGITLLRFVRHLSVPGSGQSEKIPLPVSQRGAPSRVDLGPKHECG
jgi:hypothetical protein